MLAPCTQLPANRAGLARVGRIHVLHRDAYRARFVFHKALQLTERPAVQSGTHAPTRPDAFTDVGEILRHDLGCPDPAGFRDNAFTRFMIDVSDTPPLSAGDLPECLSGTLAAVGLQTTTQGQMLIAPMAQGFTAPDPARAGGKRIFPDIHAHHRTGCHRFCLVGFDNQIEKPATAAKHQFRFLRPTTLQDFSLVIPQDHRHQHASLQGVEGDRLPLERVGAVVEMDTRAVETQGRNSRILSDASEGALRAIGFTYREDGIARHLCSEEGFLPQVAVAELVQGDSIPTARFLDKRHKTVACVGIGRPQCTQSLALFWGYVQPNTGGAQHPLAPFRDVLGAFNITLNGLGTDHASRSNIIGRRPQVPAPHYRRTLKQTSGADAFEHHIRHGNSRRNTEKQVDVIRLDFFGDHGPASFATHTLEHGVYFGRYRAWQCVAPALRTPGHMVGRLIQAIPIFDQIRPNSQGILFKYTGQHLNAIPPRTEVRGFPYGESMNTGPGIREIVVEDVLPHAREIIWKTLTDGTLISRWLMPNDFEPVVGKRFTFRTKPMGSWDGVVHCEVLEVEPCEKLVYSWKGGSDDNEAYGSKLDSVVTWTLTAVDTGTRLRLVHSGFRSPGNDFAFDAMSGGWGRIVPVISRLATELEAGNPLASGVDRGARSCA